MKINSLNTGVSANYIKKNNSNNQNFGVRLDFDYLSSKRMTNDMPFRDVMNRFYGWLSDMEPLSGVMNVKAKSGKMVPQVDYYALRTTGQNKMIYQQEDLEFSMGKAKSGFYFNEQNTNDNILSDLKYMYEVLKKESGF